MLRGGAERGYASLTFNQTGDKIASVSTSPDFLLTVWDWAFERVALHTKAFGQVREINIEFMFIKQLLIAYFQSLNDNKHSLLGNNLTPWKNYKKILHTCSV